MNIFICYRSTEGNYLRLFFEDCRIYLHNTGELGVSFDSSCDFGREEVNYRISFNHVSSYQELTDDFDFSQLFVKDKNSDGLTYYNGKLV